MSLDFAMIGCGQRAYIGQLVPLAEPDARVTVAVDTSPLGRARARQMFGDDVRVYDDLPSMLAAERALTAAIVCTPDDAHLADASALLHVGVPVYLEKPMTVHTADADRLLDAAAASERMLFVGHNMRYMSVVETMKSLIDDGAIGAVQAVWCRHFVGNGGDYYYRDWHADRSRSNSLLLQKGAHDLDVIHYLAGAPTRRLQAFGKLAVYGDVADRADNSDAITPEWFSMEHWPPRELTGLNPIIDVEDLSQVNLALANGVLATYSQCHFTPDYWRNYTVIGDAGRLENFGDGEGGVVRVWNRRHWYSADGDIEVPLHGDEDGHEDADAKIMADFVGAVLGRVARTRVNALDAREAVATADAAARSLRAGGVLTEVPAYVPGSPSA